MINNQPCEADHVAAGQKLRPFYFMVVVWGRHYCNMLLDYCIASLLSPNNIPALLNQGNKFLIATTDEDWGYIQNKPMLQQLRRYCEIVFIRIPPCPPGKLPCVHMGVGHKLLTQRAFEDRAYGAILTPDMMNSDGTVAAMQRRAVEGYQVMLTVAVRFAEEPLFENLRRSGVLSDADSNGQALLPISGSGRQFAQAALQSFHSETLTYEWGQPYMADFPSAIWHRVPGEEGVIVHSLSWAPMLFDYSAISEHDSSVMTDWTIDGDYIHKNFGLKGRVYVVQDSDELMQVSWAPSSDRPHSLKPKRYFTTRLKKFNQRIVVLSTLKSPIIDPLKRSIFATPVWIHTQDFNANWITTEQKVADNIRGCGLPPRSTGRSVRNILGFRTYSGVRVPVYFLHRAFLHGLSQARLIVFTFEHCRYHRNFVLALIKKMLRGDPESYQHAKKSISIFLGRFTKLFIPPLPPI